MSVSALQSYDKTREEAIAIILTLTGLRARRYIPEVILWPALRGVSASNFCPIGRATIFICHLPLKETMRQHDFFIGVLVPQLEVPFLRISQLVLHQVLSGGERERERNRGRARSRAPARARKQPRVNFLRTACLSLHRRVLLRRRARRALDLLHIVAIAVSRQPYVAPPRFLQIRQAIALRSQILAGVYIGSHR